jgi:hypothetical protein
VRCGSCGAFWLLWLLWLLLCCVAAALLHAEPLLWLLSSGMARSTNEVLFLALSFKLTHPLHAWRSLTCTSFFPLRALRGLRCLRAGAWGLYHAQCASAVYYIDVEL